MANCSIPDCEKTAKARGWCAAHHERWRRHGSPNVVLPKPRSVFWEFRPSWPRDNRCLEWPGASDGKGYGRLDNRPVHRLVYEAFTDEEPEVVRHSCDNPLCYRFEHLLGGTHQDNVRDRVERNRSAMGSKNKGGRRKKPAGEVFMATRDSSTVE